MHEKAFSQNNICSPRTDPDHVPARSMRKHCRKHRYEFRDERDRTDEGNGNTEACGINDKYGSIGELSF